jgi:hypothetical protein
VRQGLARDDYRDPGNYAHPKGSVAYEWAGASMNPVRAPTSRTDGSEVLYRARKPRGHAGH